MNNYHSRLYTVALIFLVLFALIVVSALAIGAGAGFLDRFQIMNATGKIILVTSAHTQKTIRIPDQQMVSVPHSSGDIIVKLPNGKSWTYKSLAVSSFRSTPYEIKKVYTFFSVQDGYLVKGSTTVNLLLDKNGNLYAIPPGVKDIEAEKLKQPKGFPIKP